MGKVIKIVFFYTFQVRSVLEKRFNTDALCTSDLICDMSICEFPPAAAITEARPPYKCATLKTYVFTRLYCVNSYVSVYTHVNVCKLSDQRMLRVANGSKRFVANKAHLQRCTQTTLESD